MGELGMFGSIEVLMIGRQMWWLISFNSWQPIYLQGLRWLFEMEVDKNMDFTIRSFYHKLHGSSSVVFPWKGIWKVKAPRHVSFFLWTATWDRILTGDNLQLRGFDFVDWCIMCCCCGETVDHLLLRCEKAHHLWCFAFKIFGISWIPSRTVLDLLFSWWNWLG